MRLWYPHSMAISKKGEMQMLTKLLDVSDPAALNRFLESRADADPAFRAELLAWLRSTLLPLDAKPETIRERVVDIFSMCSLQEFKTKSGRPYERYQRDWPKVSDALHLLFDDLEDDILRHRGTPACAALLEFLRHIGSLMYPGEDFHLALWALRAAPSLLMSAMRCPDVNEDAKRAIMKELKHIAKLEYFKHMDIEGIMPDLIERAERI